MATPRPRQRTKGKAEKVVTYRRLNEVTSVIAGRIAAAEAEAGRRLRALERELAKLRYEQVAVIESLRPLADRLARLEERLR